MRTSSTEARDRRHMLLALEQARRGVGRTSPNPAVGAVIARGNEVLATGFHRAAGRPHAEIEALRALPSKFRPARVSLYVTLEPCSTHGRTPPCVAAIIESGIRRVVIGTLDPNPAHAGRAVPQLRKAGIEVITGVLETECRLLNRAFNKWIVSGAPYVIAKAGMSLDGRLTRPPGEGRWLTSAASRSDAHKLRAEVDAILIGAGTLRTDDPALTVRGVRGSKQPWRVIVSRGGELPATARVFTDSHQDRTLVYRRKSLRQVLADLGRREVTSVLIEGGMRVLGEAFDRGLVDAVHVYLAPVITGGPVLAVGGRGAGATSEAAQLVDVAYEKIGDDVKMTATVVRPPGKRAGAKPARM